MKKLWLFLLGCLLSNNLVQGQFGHTNYGTNSGLGGSYSSFFGNNTGFNNSGSYNTGVGYFSLQANTTGTNNTGVGYYALSKNTTGYQNTGTGSNALYNNRTGILNTAQGYNSLFLNSSGGYNTSIGANAMVYNTTGSYNTAVGSYSLRKNTEGTFNTAIGYEALTTNTTSGSNTAVGYQAMKFNSSGNLNTATGTSALYNNTTGGFNTTMGASSLYSNTTGNSNTAMGASSLYNNTTGTGNTAIGGQALQNNTTANNNTAIGRYSLAANTTGYSNTSIGESALIYNSTGHSNVAIGNHVLGYNSTGDYNVGIGVNAIFDVNGNENVAIGYSAMEDCSAGNNNTVLGSQAVRNTWNGSNNTVVGAGTSFSIIGGTYNNSAMLGYQTIATASNQVNLGNSSVTAIRGQVPFSTYSDGRIKDNVKEDVVGLEFINLLRPVTYNFNIDREHKILGIEDSKNYTGKYDLEKIKFSGFIAQEVEQAAKKIDYNFSGVKAPNHEKDLYTVSYAEFVVPLVKSVQELDQKVKNQEQTIEDLKELAQQQQAQIERLLNANANTLGTESIETVAGAELFDNTPNPFTTTTTIQMYIPQESNEVLLVISNLEGKELLSKSIQAKGTTSLDIDGGALDAGVYIYTLVVDNKIIASKKMILTK